MARWHARVAIDVAALRAGYVAVLLSMAGTLLVALAILGPPVDPAAPRTVAAALDVPQGPRLEARRALAAARATAACMARLGLAYDPIPAPLPAIPDPQLDPVAWAARWGFGVATSVERPAAARPADADDRQIAAMAELGRTRYLAALFGDGNGSGGCHGAAIASVYGLRDRLLEPLRGPLSELAAAIDGDPGSASAMGRWQACVAATGMADAERSSLVARLRARFVDRVLAAGSDAARLAAIAVEERLVAVTVARCEEDYGRAMAAVGAPHEARFVATYRSLLTRIGARIRAAEAAYPTFAMPGRAWRSAPR